MRILAAFFVVLLFMISSQAFATSPRRYSDDDKEFFKSIYDSCKQAVTAKSSEKDFQKTLCYAHIKGAQEATQTIGMSFGMLVSAYAGDSCKELGEAIDSTTEGVCAPESLEPYQFAKDYVAYMDSKDYKPYHESVVVDATDTEAIKKNRSRAS